MPRNTTPTEEPGVEYAAGPWRHNSYPAEWGIPPGRPASEQRARWVRQHVRQHQSDTDPHARLAATEARILAILRLHDLKRRMEGPR